ncbi:Pimeloyl-ACP methyl ester carboxylesterase [Chelatococcus asaccharovorans]|uniref:Pimeloyl-ACP methyl ester carboxylesterase n=1 Tax=Chelatococcus asaccharovorans TaxID=28210 RepID=A0A2V3UB69_9HYPH|nr:pimeloyl-ACP methyl ester carboxylesterase [Chelatococcus asaccharovorans]CAH1671406.1 Pimeloyl-ACP methyl ester carboxylesterase [Chelatococcus asaccharovorans]CAH1677173.1 Pimeloyl-ACP methyl ester carboxylesterase [Chelatococcus asaccharovorans]
MNDGYRDEFMSASDGLRLHVRIYGNRPSGHLPVVCLPGLARTAADFHELSIALASDSRRPRRVIAVDYRGRGLSEWDKDWTHYDPQVEVDDLIQVLTALGVPQAIFVGTSRGGLLIMALAVARAGIIQGAVLNDVGPVLDPRGLIRIRGYIGKLPTPADFREAVGILKLLSNAQFPTLGDADWDLLARRTWVEEKGKLIPAYDPALVRTLESVDLEEPLPDLWNYCDLLRHVPLLTIRGANSDILSEATLSAMQARYPKMEALTIPDQGHTPLTWEPAVMKAILRFVQSIDTQEA